MAQLAPPQLSKHPIPPSSNVNGSATASPFIPRKEFIRDQRVISSFSLLALSGANLVRLYSFPPTAIAALRRLFDHQDLIVSVREHAHKHFFEFCLDRRPWASPKSIESEKLIISILSAILQCGYSFLSSVDYGREPDDRLAIAFSKPVSVSSSGQLATGSVVTLSQPVRAPFAISFVSPSLLRVINPPLHSTPAILQAVRGSWPRGVVSEKKFGDATYQFKLKGYKFFQEDTFAADSLQQILTLLTTLDKHAFTLLTSLTLTNRSRKQDLWIFTGPSEDTPSVDSPHSSPGGSSLELKDNASYPLQASNEKLAPIGSSYRTGNAVPATSSPLRPSFPPLQKVPGNMLRKVSPKVQIPLAFMPDTDSATNSPVDNKQHPFSSSMGSVDMTGIGSGRGKGGERLSRSPDVLYMTAGVPGYGHSYGYRDELNPWHAAGQVVPPSHVAYTPAYAGSVESSAPQRSPPLQETTSHSRSGSSGPPSSQSLPLPVGLAMPPSHTSIPSSEQQPTTQYLDVHIPSATHATGLDYFNSEGFTQGREQDPAKRDQDNSPRAPPDIPRTPTPPLLTPGVFRDSAFSSTAGHNSYIPIAWTGREPEPERGTLAGIKEEEEERQERERSRERLPIKVGAERVLAGPTPPGAWAPTPKDERRYDDVSNMLPPTIQEHPSQEQDELVRIKGDTRRIPQDAHAHGTATSSLAAEVERVGDHSTSTSSPSDRTAQSSARNGTTDGLKGRRSPTRRDTDTSGWVLVNINQAGRTNDNSKGKSRQAKSVSPDPSRRTKSPVSSTGSGPASQHRPQPHTRSSSESRLPRSHQGQPKDPGAATGSMSAAAKAIVIIDAVGAKEKEQEKSSSGSGFKRIFTRNRDKGQSDLRTQTLSKSSDPSRHKPRATEGMRKRSLDAERNEKQSRERWKAHAAASSR